MSGGNIALENALANHNIQVAEWLLKQGYRPSSRDLNFHLESALQSANKNKNWQFIDWVFTERDFIGSYEHLSGLLKFEDYWGIAWKRNNFVAIMEQADTSHLSAALELIKTPLSRAIDKQQFAKSMQILKRALQDDVSKYISLSDSTLLSRILDFADAATIAKRTDVTEELATIVKNKLEDMNDRQS